MNRILVIGCGGSGKSTFARKLCLVTHIPLYHLDLLWHKPDHTTVSREKFDQDLAAILATDRWIIDGNFQRTLPQRIHYCDTVFLFDLPLEDCIVGVEQRIGQKRPDMPWIETEFEPEFREWIVNFNKSRLPGIMELLAKSDCDKIIFKTREEADRYLGHLGTFSPADQNTDEF